MKIIEEIEKNPYMTKSLKETYKSTILALMDINNIINDNFLNIVDVIYNTKGKVVITGMGKSGLIGRKISATLASTGTASFFIHPGEAYHGDLGMISEDDIVIAISHSGNTEEVINIIPILKKYIGVKIIGITSNRYSKLAKESDYKIIYNIINEGYLDLPPMASTTTQLVIGDLIASLLMEKRNFTDKNFAIFHPGGTLGKKLLLKVENILDEQSRNIQDLIVDINSDLESIIISLTQGKKGGVIIVNDNKIVGVFTDGDLRRLLQNKGIKNIYQEKIENIMTKNPKIGYIDQTPFELLNIMETYNITFLPILDRNNQLVGAVNIHDLVKRGIK